MSNQAFFQRGLAQLQKKFGGKTLDKTGGKDGGKGSGQLKLNNRKYLHNIFILTILFPGYYERKGTLFKRSMNAEKHEFKKR